MYAPRRWRPSRRSLLACAFVVVLGCGEARRDLSLRFVDSESGVPVPNACASVCALNPNMLEGGRGGWHGEIGPSGADGVIVMKGVSDRRTYELNVGVRHAGPFNEYAAAFVSINPREGSARISTPGPGGSGDGQCERVALRGDALTVPLWRTGRAAP